MSRLTFREVKSMSGVSDDWLSRTIRTVEAVMKQHGFVEDSLQKSSFQKQRNRVMYSIGTCCYDVLTCFVSPRSFCALPHIHSTSCGLLVWGSFRRVLPSHEQASPKEGF